MKIKPIYFGIIITTMIMISCKSDDSMVCDPGPVFDVDLFIQLVNGEMATTPIAGYQFVVNQDGEFYHQNANGVSRHELDPGGEIPMTASTLMNVASVSKFIGAIALMNVLEESGLHLDSTVVNSLPQTWKDTIHDDFSVPNTDAHLTFRRLLTMKTAIDFTGSTPSPGSMLSEADMLTSLILPPKLSRIGTYQNANFTLIRVLIGKLKFNLNEEDTLTYATECSEKYFEYIKESIFDPIGINAPLTPQAVNNYYSTNSYTLAYQWPFDSTYQSPSNGTLGWRHSSNPYLNGGSGGLILSAMDLAKLMTSFKYNKPNSIISSEQRDKILSDDALGLSNSLINATYGPSYIKQGRRGADSCCGRGLRSIVAFFPNNVEAVLLSNSNHNDLRNVLQDNFEAAFINPCN